MINSPETQMRYLPHIKRDPNDHSRYDIFSFKMAKAYCDKITDNSTSTPQQVHLAAALNSIVEGNLAQGAQLDRIETALAKKRSWWG
jgi:hypothetical protein